MRPEILFLCMHPRGGAPSQRFRFEQYIPILEDHGFEVSQEPFLDEKTDGIFYHSGHVVQKILGVAMGYFRRFKLLSRAQEYDYVFVHLEVTPMGPPLIEMILLKLGGRVIYDIDDAIFLDRVFRKNRLVSFLKWPSRVTHLTRYSYKVVTVNQYLHDWAKRFNKNVTIIPTTVDPDIHHPRNVDKHNRIPVLGWTGSHSTAPYLDIVRPVLKELQETHDFCFHVICDIDPAFPEIENYHFYPWNKKTEIVDLQRFDIGLMPVPNTDWAKGKIGFKAIQYSALGLPSVVSDVGSGREVVNDGITGYVVSNDRDEWHDALIRLIEDPELRSKLGRAARRHILDRYTILSQSQNYINLFQ